MTFSTDAAEELAERIERRFGSNVAPEMGAIARLQPLPEWLPKAGLVSTNELAGLVSFPSSAIHDQRLETTANVATVPPSLYTQTGIRLGTAQALGTNYEVTLPDPVRNRHVYVFGRTRSGKSTLLFNMILQDILRGTCFISKARRRTKIVKCHSTV